MDALLLAGNGSAGGWLRTLLQEELPVQSYGRLLLLPTQQPPVAVAARGKRVCVCLNVTDTDITERLGQCQGSPAERLAQLQGALRCGTQCGSCVPELKRMVQAAVAGIGTTAVQAA